MKPISECRYISCKDCGRGIFAEPNGRMAQDHICSPCRDFPDRKTQSTANPYDVAPGQVWQDLDPRRPWRQVRVLEIDLSEGRAHVFDGRRRSWVKLASFAEVKGRGFERTA